MAKLQNKLPKYRRHKATDQAVVTLSGKDHYLGLWRSKASRQKYDRLTAEWLANGRRKLDSPGAGLTVLELVDRYFQHVEKYYVKNGLPTDEQNCIKAALRPLLRLFENELATKVGPIALVAVRDAMVECGWTRQTVNKQVDRIRRMYRWAVAQELIPETCYHALLAVEGLRKGRCSVRESKPVKPVDDATIEATLPHLTRTVADMVQVQRLTGMRPAELCIMRPCDLDRSGDVWTYQPESHKCEHHDQLRTVFIGPQAQGILLRYLARDAAMYCFRPVDSEAKRRAEQHAARKTPLGYGNRPGRNRKRRPKRAPSECYTTDTYRRAIERACDRRAMIAAAPYPFAPLKGESVSRWYKRLTGVSKEILTEHLKKFRWSPNRLRHAAATEIRRKFGLEAAQILLGHAKADTTQIYAERDLAKGVEIARKIG